MTTESRAACAGTPYLWESVDPRDHVEAKKVCLNDCPARDWCYRQLEETLASVHGSGVRGTWAGLFFGKKGSKSKGTCPKCGVLDGQACESPKGKKVGAPHQARILGLPRCKTCGIEFVPDRSNVGYCSTLCSDEGKRARHRRHDQKRPSVIAGNRTRAA